MSTIYPVSKPGDGGSMVDQVVRGLTIACLAVMASATCFADTPSTYQLRIERQSLATALQEFAKQSGVQIIFFSKLTRDYNAPALEGAYAPATALNLLLQGTDLTFLKIGENIFQVEPRAASARNGSIPPSAQSGEGAQRADGAGVVRLSQAENTENTTPSPAGTPSSSKGEGRNEGISEIIVTAQKRKESLQDVPIAISVLGGEDLDASSLSDIRDALNSVSSLDLTHSAGFTGGSLVSIRGVGNGTYREGGASTVAYYMDGTPYGFVRTAIVPLDSDPYDLERIEVLRGPQGSLYGASSLNGVIRVLTHNANTKAFELKGRTYLSNTEDGSGNYGGNLAVNVPLIQDKLAVRGVIGYRSDSGWIESPIDNNVNSSKLQSYRFKVRAEPTETLTINLSAWHSKSNYGAPSFARDDNRITTAEDESGLSENDVFGSEIIKDFGAFSLSSMTSYIDSEMSGRFDGSPAGAGLALLTSVKSKIFAEELNVVSQNDGPWRWSVGAFYRDAKDVTYQFRDWLPPSTNPDVVNNNYQDTSKSIAVYGEIGRRLFDDKLEIAAGLRYFHDKQSLRALSAYLTGFPLTPIRSSAEAVTPRVVLTWTPTTASTFYASYSQGFRSGLAQAPNVQVAAPIFPPAKPDKLYNYEVGAKGSLLDGRLTYEGALYYIDWQDVQQTVSVILIAGSLSAQGVVNAVSASGLGTEFSLSTRATERLELGTRFSWNDLTFDSAVVQANGTVLFPKGGRLFVSPKYTAGAFASYSFPLGDNGLTGAFEISGGYKSAQTFYQLVAGVYVPVDGNERFDGGSASVSITARDRWTARLFADNITNEHSSQDPIGLNGRRSDLEWRGRSRPRTMGVQLEYRFE